MKRIEENMFCPLCGHPTTQRLRHVHNIREAGDWSSVDGAPIYADVVIHIFIDRGTVNRTPVSGLSYVMNVPETLRGGMPAERAEHIFLDPFHKYTSFEFRNLERVNCLTHIRE